MPEKNVLVVIKNKYGLHARPATKFVDTATKYKSDIRLRSNGQTVNGKSILEVMMLAAGFDSEIEIMAEGEDAEQAASALSELVAAKFGEEAAAE